MRLSQEHRAAIVRIVQELAGPSAEVRLFGSRTDDAARGGDVDLLIELAEEPADRDALERALYARIFRTLKGRPLDLLLVTPSSSRRPIHQHAQRTGVRL